MQVRELYRERVALEREYAAKLQVLTRKASDKKSKLEAALVVGEDPTKSWDKNTLRQRLVFHHLAMIYKFVLTRG